MSTTTEAVVDAVGDGSTEAALAAGSGMAAKIPVWFGIFGGLLVLGIVFRIARRSAGKRV